MLQILLQAHGNVSACGWTTQIWFIGVVPRAVRTRHGVGPGVLVARAEGGCDGSHDRLPRGRPSVGQRRPADGVAHHLRQNNLTIDSITSGSNSQSFIRSTAAAGVRHGVNPELNAAMLTNDGLRILQRVKRKRTAASRQVRSTDCRAWAAAKRAPSCSADRKVESTAMPCASRVAD